MNHARQHEYHQENEEKSPYAKAVVTIGTASIARATPHCKEAQDNQHDQQKHVIAMARFSALAVSSLIP